MAPVSRSAALPRASEASAAPGSNPLDWAFRALAGRVQYPCLDRACRERQRLGLTDNPRVRCRIVVTEVGGAVVERSDLSTPRQVFQHNLHLENGSVHLQMDVRCGTCDAVATTILPNDTTERLYLAFRELVTHDRSLPLLYVPREPGKNQSIPDDAKAVCALAHEFDATLLTQRMIKRISASLRAGELRDKLGAKMRSKGPGLERLTYLRIGVGLRRLGDAITPILELWPAGHQSPRHQHGGCAGSVRVLHGKLNVRLYDNLWDAEPMRFRTGDGGLDLPPGEHAELLLKDGDTTWMNRANWFVHEVSCLQEHPENIDGFALSLHVYKSCTDEFEFVDARQAKKGNPENDFLWNVDLPEDDPRLTDARAPAEFEDAIAPRAASQVEGSRREDSAVGGGDRPRLPPRAGGPLGLGEATGAPRRAEQVPGLTVAGGQGDLEHAIAPRTAAEVPGLTGAGAPPNAEHAVAPRAAAEERTPAHADPRQDGCAAGCDRPAGAGGRLARVQAGGAPGQAGQAGRRLPVAQRSLASLRGCTPPQKAVRPGGVPGERNRPTYLGAPSDVFQAPDVDTVRQGDIAAGHGRLPEPQSPPNTLKAEQPAAVLQDGVSEELDRHELEDVMDFGRRKELMEIDIERALDAQGDRLRTADFRECDSLTDALVKLLSDRCPVLQSVNFSECSQLTDAAVEALARTCPKLRDVDVAKCEHITDAAAEHLANRCHELRRAIFFGCPEVTDAAAEALARGCPELQEVDLGWCKNVTDAAAKHLAKGCWKLRKVGFWGCPQMTDTAAEVLAKNCLQLQEVEFSWCKKMTGAAAKHLRGVRKVSFKDCPLVMA